MNNVDILFYWTQETLETQLSPPYEGKISKTTRTPKTE